MCSHGMENSRINLDHGDPLMYESYWKSHGEKGLLILSGDLTISYFSNQTDLCWFLEPELKEQIKRVHQIVGNAVIEEDDDIVIGNGACQLIHAALYALSECLNVPNPISIVSATPSYPVYQKIADLVRSSLFKWAGDAYTFKGDEQEPYIEIVNSPNNPDGSIREPVVNGRKGMCIHDLVYYWPQYTPITSPANHEIMLFTLSKCTGHAGSRIGWAIVKDKNVATKMVEFISFNTLGVSREAQLRAANILSTVSSSCNKAKPREGLDNFFIHSKNILAERWNKLRDTLNKNKVFSISVFSSEYCNFTGDFTSPNPAFAWIKCNERVDLEKLLEEQEILTRGGPSFGCGLEYTRVSMMSRDEEFDVFLKRISNIHGVGL